MRAVVQRVCKASVTVEGRVIGSIGRGLLVLLGVGREDTESDADWLADKIVGLRIFEDEQGKMNLSLKQTGGEMMVVSQFTLFGDCRKGKRPSFARAMEPRRARELCDYFVEKVRQAGIKCGTGAFGAYMQVELVNDGPVTLLVDSSVPRRASHEAFSD